MSDNQLPILYKCPYCSKGRFTAEDGFEGAMKHIREKHTNGKRRRSRRPRAPADGMGSVESSSLFSEASFY